MNAKFHKTIVQIALNYMPRSFQDFMITDTYTKDCYRLIGKICLSPLLQFFKLPGLFQRIFLLNIGKRFNITYLQKFSIL